MSALALADKMRRVIERQALEIVRLKAQNDVLTLTIARMVASPTAWRGTIPSKPCSRCGDSFAPRSGVAIYCDDCRPVVRKAMAAAARRRRARGTLLLMA